MSINNAKYHEYDIINVKVKFPYRAYGSQLSMMTRTIDSLNHGHNALLESPTGTGKTMALLCASLAWLQHQTPENLEKKESEIPYRIYFGTRTHKQVTQVVRELSRSPYHNVKMTILSSRKYSCVNDLAISSKNIDKKCKELRDFDKTNPNMVIDRPICTYRKDKEKKLPDTSWDLEEIKPKLEKQHFCPYFQCREWMVPAQIIFCPYNYLLDPNIRRSTGLQLHNSIVILDEAHNTEDNCREAMSSRLSHAQLTDQRKELARLITHKTYLNQRDQRITQLLNMLDTVYKFTEALKIKTIDTTLSNNASEMISNSWDCYQLRHMMDRHGINMMVMKEFSKILKELGESEEVFQEPNEENEEDGEDKEPALKIHLKKEVDPMLLNMLEMFVRISKCILDVDSGYSNDFRFVVSLEECYKDLDESEPGSWKNSRAKRQKTMNTVVSMLCMHPRVVFQHLDKKCHSIILASGTMAPLSSFQQELDVAFPSSLEAFHVVPRAQTFIATVDCGPHGYNMEAVYKNVYNYGFQDELGRILLNSCGLVPSSGGVLCFVSSFQLLESLVDRWQSTGLMDSLDNLRQVVIEPRTMPTNQMESSGRAQLLLAVYRGKMSEGVDFADDAARLVIAVGIPYPNAGDIKVQLKKHFNNTLGKQDVNNYNNSNTSTMSESLSNRPHLSGSEWYKIQAYRALNQAIGRCIRHQGDWGGIIMVDSRLNNSTSGLCRWTRDRIVHYSRWGGLEMDLKQFYSQMPPTIPQ